MFFCEVLCIASWIYAFLKLVFFLLATVEVTIYSSKDEYIFCILIISSYRKQYFYFKLSWIKQWRLVNDNKINYYLHNWYRNKERLGNSLQKNHFEN